MRVRFFRCGKNPSRMRDRYASWVKDVAHILDMCGYFSIRVNIFEYMWIFLYIIAYLNIYGYIWVHVLTSKL